jgi:hypothetical protein
MSKRSDCFSLSLIIIIGILLIWRYLDLKQEGTQKSKEKFDLNLDWFYQKSSPAKPIIISLLSLPAGIEVIWKRPQTAPDAPITRYAILLKNNDNNLSDLFMNFIQNTDCEECHYVFENLNPETNYSVSIIASNKYGDSLPAVPFSIRTLDNKINQSNTPPAPPAHLPHEPTIPANNVQPKFWEDHAKELEKAKTEVSKDQYDHLIESAQGVLEIKDAFPDFFPKDYLSGLENESQKLGDLLNKSLYAGEAVVKINK